MEKAIEAIPGVQWTHMRCDAFMENLSSQASSIQEYKCFMGGMGEGKNAAVAAGDIGRACAAALLEGGDKHGGKAYDITGPQSLSSADVAAIVSKHVGFTVTYRDMAPEAWGKQLGEWGLPKFLCDILVELNTMYRTQAADVVSQDVATLTGKHTTWDQWIAARAAMFGAAPGHKASAAVVAPPASAVWFLPKTEQKLWWA